MEFNSETSGVINDFILSVLVFLSDVALKWVPAAFEAVLGIKITTPIDNYNNSVSGSNVGTVENTSSTSEGNNQGNQSPDVSVEGTVYNSNGSIETTTSEGNAAASSGDSFVTGTESFVTNTFDAAWHIFAPVSIFISLVLATIAIYALIRLFQVRYAESQAFNELVEEEQELAEQGAVLPGGIVLPSGSEPRGMQKRWERIESQIASEEENEWRLAILEADIMLDEALEQAGYQGESIGEKLKSANRGDFRNLDAAWEAHKMRNHIAHRGSKLDINHRQAKQAILHFRNALEELGVL